MKKFLKIAGIVLLSIIGLILLASLTIHLGGLPKVKVEMPESMASLKVDVTPERVERGAAIASMLCKNCHMDSKTGKFSGKQLIDLPKEFGTVYSANITHDKEVGIGQWTDGQLAYFFRTGVNKDGVYIPPYMPKFPLMSDEDIYSIIAFLRSDREELQPEKREPPKNIPNFLVKLLCKVAFKPHPLPSGPIVKPDTTDQVALGKYYALGMLGCYQCHSADFKTNNDLEPEKSVGFFGGGNPLLNLEGEIIPSRNITFDEETGIGKKYTKEQFIEAVKYGRTPDGTTLRYPMEPHTALTDAEAGAIYEYLKTVPKIKNKVQDVQVK